MEKKELSPKLEGHRILLKKHDESLAGTMFTYIDRDRKRLGEFLPWVPFIKAEDDELNWIRKTYQWWSECSHFDYSLIRKSDGLYMGNIGVHNIRWEHNGCEIGYWILHDFEGHGFMSEALRTLEKHLFEVGFHRIEVRCSSANTRSAHVPQACGYQLEGTLRQDAIENGRYRDTLVFGKIRSEKPS